jgi:hypothetical protein
MASENNSSTSNPTKQGVMTNTSAAIQLRASMLVLAQTVDISNPHFKAIKTIQNNVKVKANDYLYKYTKKLIDINTSIKAASDTLSVTLPALESLTKRVVTDCENTCNNEAFHAIIKNRLLPALKSQTNALINGAGSLSSASQKVDKFKIFCAAMEKDFNNDVAAFEKAHDEILALIVKDQRQAKTLTLKNKALHTNKTLIDNKIAKLTTQIQSLHKDITWDYIAIACTGGIGAICWGYAISQDHKEIDASYLKLSDEQGKADTIITQINNNLKTIHKDNADLLALNVLSLKILKLKATAKSAASGVLNLEVGFDDFSSIVTTFHKELDPDTISKKELKTDSFKLMNALTNLKKLELTWQEVKKSVNKMEQLLYIKIK